MNVKITWIILHEIEHGNHKKIYKENKSEILTKIIKPCIEISNGTLPLLIPFSKEELVNWLDYHHDSFLDERLADITALSTILKVLEIDKDLFPTLYPYTKNTFYNFLFRGYKENTNPLKHFFTIIKYPHLYDAILSFEKKNPLGNDSITKMTLGFPISSTEYQRIRKKQKNSYYEDYFDLDCQNF